jgi:hypothetical protein
MAIKKKTKTPAVRFLRYELTNSATPGTETSHYIDLARDLSAINRRLYRQGRDYHVKRVSVISSNTIAAPGGSAGRVTCATVPDSWTVRNAWRRGFEMWNKMNKLALDNGSASIKPKFHDFKIRGIGAYAPTPTYETPLDNGGNAVALGEWSYSSIVSPDGTTSTDSYFLHMLGDHIASGSNYSSVGLVKSYAETRATVDTNNPNTAAVNTDDPLLNLFDDGTQVDEIADNLLTIGEDTPYDRDTYPGETGNMPQPLVVQQTTLGADGRATVGGFNAICGLLEIETTSPVANDVYSVLVELAPGSYRGIAAEVI